MYKSVASVPTSMSEAFESASFPVELRKAISAIPQPSAAPERDTAVDEFRPSLLSAGQVHNGLRRRSPTLQMLRRLMTRRDKHKHASLVVTMRSAVLLHVVIGILATIVFWILTSSPTFGGCYLLGVISLACYLELELRRASRRPVRINDVA